MTHIIHLPADRQVTQAIMKQKTIAFSGVLLTQSQPYSYQFLHYLVTFW